MSPRLPGWALTAAWALGTIYATIPAFWLALHPFKHRWQRVPGKIYPQLGLVWLAFILLAAVATARWRQDVIFSSPWLWLLAATMFASGMFIYRRVSSYFTLDRLIGREELGRAPGSLVTTGMHARVRHPIYLAHVLELSALAAATGSKANIALLAFAIATGWAMIAAEERELAARFGEDFRQYQKRVPAILPF